MPGNRFVNVRVGQLFTGGGVPVFNFLEVFPLLAFAAVEIVFGGYIRKAKLRELDVFTQFSCKHRRRIKSGVGVELHYRRTFTFGVKGRENVLIAKDRVEIVFEAEGITTQVGAYNFGFIKIRNTLQLGVPKSTLVKNRKSFRIEVIAISEKKLVVRG